MAVWTGDSPHRICQLPRSGHFRSCLLSTCLVRRRGIEFSGNQTALRAVEPLLRMDGAEIKVTHEQFKIQSTYKPEEVAVLAGAYRQAAEALGARVPLDAHGKAEIASLVMINYPLYRDASRLAAAVIERMSWSATLLSRIVPTLPAVMMTPGYAE